MTFCEDAGMNAYFNCKLKITYKCRKPYDFLGHLICSKRENDQFQSLEYLCFECLAGKESWGRRKKARDNLLSVSD
jgi:hypothetical protein